MSSGVTFYASGKVAKLKTMPQMLRSEALAAVRRGTRVVRREIHNEFIKRGIGAALYEGRGTRILGGSSLKTIIKSGRTKYTGENEITTGVYMKGTAALVAQGGRTVKHDISPSRMKFGAQSRGGIDGQKAAKRMVEFQRYNGNASFGLKGALSNQARGGGFFSANTVHHPGSQLKRDDFAGRGMFRGMPKFEQEISKGVAKVADIVNKAA